MSPQKMNYIKETLKERVGVVYFGKTAYKILNKIYLLCQIRNKKFNIQVAIIEGDLPLLLRRETMRRMKFENETVDIGDLRKINLKTVENET